MRRTTVLDRVRRVADVASGVRSRAVISSCVLATCFAATAAPAFAAPGDITTVAGNGVSGFSGDGGPATSASIANAQGVSVTADGGFLIRDTDNQRVRKVAKDGTITTVAGDGSGASLDRPAGDGGQATSAQLTRGSGVAALPDGSFLISDTGLNRIRKVDAATGIISTVAGSARGGFTAGDGGPATSALLLTPVGVAALPLGGYLIVDQGNQSIRKVDAAGIITTVAGTGTPAAFGGDGGPATSAQLSNPTGVTPTADGGFLIADGGNRRVRKVDAAGIITTVAGNGATSTEFLCSKVSAPATASPLKVPSAVVATADGGFLFADSSSHCVRKVDARGAMTTVAGTGDNRPAFAPLGDGGPATAARIAFPDGVDVTADGGYIINDRGNSRVRKVLGVPAGPVDTDGDGVTDANDKCAGTPAGAKVGPDGCVVVIDTDGDGVADGADNCPDIANQTQANFDGDALGDACDADDDNDGIADANDQCAGTSAGVRVASDGCADPDGDGTSNAAGDNCPTVANPGQTNTDGDSEGDACDADDDNDNVVDANDKCPGTAAGATVNADGCVVVLDTDGDGTPNTSDNCPAVANAAQGDIDRDGVGDACDQRWFDFGGFLRPVDGGGVLNVVKAGSAIPVKYSLGGDKGLNIFEPGFPQAHKRTSCAAEGSDTIEETVVASRSGLKYDAASQTYIYVWKTETTMTGCWSLRLSSNDDRTVALFQFK